MHQLYNLYLSGPLNEKQLSEFRTWFPINISVSQEKYLSFEGGVEMKKLSLRMQKRFKSVIPQIYDNKTFTVRTFIIYLSISQS